RRSEAATPAFQDAQLLDTLQRLMLALRQLGEELALLTGQRLAAASDQDRAPGRPCRTCEGVPHNVGVFGRLAHGDKRPQADAPLGPLAASSMGASLAGGAGACMPDCATGGAAYRALSAANGSGFCGCSIGAGRIPSARCA